MSSAPRKGRYRKAREVSFGCWSVVSCIPTQGPGKNGENKTRGAVRRGGSRKLGRKASTMEAHPVEGASEGDGNVGKTNERGDSWSTPGRRTRRYVGGDSGEKTRVLAWPGTKVCFGLGSLGGSLEEDNLEVREVYSGGLVQFSSVCWSTWKAAFGRCSAVRSLHGCLSPPFGLGGLLRSRQNMEEAPLAVGPDCPVLACSERQAVWA